MLIIPSMDLYQNKVVRTHSAYDNDMEVLSFDPYETAREFKMQGVTHMHMVDIDSSRTGKIVNLDVCRKIKRDFGFFIQVGGGIRNLELIKRFIDAGADRVMLGSVAIEKEEVVRNAVALYGDKIAVIMDMKDGFVTAGGRTRKTGVKVDEFADRMQDIGVRTFICNDVSGYACNEGVDRDLFENLKERTGADIIASGGVQSLEDILLLNEIEMYGVLVGQAYYQGAVSLKEAMRITK